MIEQRKCLGTVAYMGGVMSLPEPFVWSWTQMVQFNTESICQPGEYIHYDRAQVSLHSVARNSLVSRMYGDWLLMLDTDLTFDPDLLARLLMLWTRYGKEYKIDVLTGVYCYKTAPHLPVLNQWDEKNNTHQRMGDWPADAKLFEIGSSGAGCLLVKRKVFERIISELKEDPFSIIPPFGEDYSFFARLRKLGIPAWCAPQVTCGHLMYRPVTVDDTRYDVVEMTGRSVRAFADEGALAQC